MYDPGDAWSILCYRDRLIKLMEQAGYEQVKRLDDVFFQPVLIGIKGQ